MNPKAGQNRVRGLEFENIFQWKAKAKGFTLFKIQLGAKQVGPNKFIRVQTPFDWIIIKGGKSAYIDTKRLAQGNLTASKVTPHQAHALYLCHLAGVVAGYVVWNEKLDEIHFYDAQKLTQILRSEKQIKPVKLGKLLDFDLDLLF